MAPPSRQHCQGLPRTGCHDTLIAKRRPPSPCTILSHHVSAEQQPGEQHISVVLAAPSFLWMGTSTSTSTSSLTNAGPSSDGQFWNSTQRLAKKYRTEGAAYFCPLTDYGGTR
ncbi:hypothetical protein B0H65DRAFT_549915 [Neurospora tetraspora]|uniref:Uncharacterized protein n=1 Tax=Neurospora tetraspora TaxID=94610 RepID=A0AAE0JCQ5_9PEZI|nr:hypothetical protein B0H65DRAFT_549915 [Neurospora tetraspora]